MPDRRPLTAAAAAAWLAVALGLVVLAPASPALAASAGYTAVGEVPDDVRAAFTGEELRKGVRTAETDAMTELRAGTIHQEFGFTSDFYDGEATDTPVEPYDSWVAGVEGDGAPAGWLRVYRPDPGAPPVPTGWLADPQQGAAMLASTESAFVGVPQDGAFFTLVDGTVTPVVVSQWDQGLGARSLAQVQQDLLTARAASEGACEGREGCSGGGSGGMGGGTAGPSLALADPRVWGSVIGITAVVGALFAWDRRQRRRAPAQGWD